MRFLSKKIIALLAVMAVAVSAAVGAYAYFSASGSGNGTSSSATASSWVVSNALPAADNCNGYCDANALWPDQPDDLGSVYVTNNNAGPLTIQSVTVAITGISGYSNSPTCDLSKFNFVDPGNNARNWHITRNDASGTTAMATYDFPGKTTVGAGSYLQLPDLELQLDNTPNVNQDGCESALLTLSTSVS